MGLKFKRYKTSYYTYMARINEKEELVYRTKDGKFRLNIYTKDKLEHFFNYHDSDIVIDHFPEWTNLVKTLKELAKEDLREPGMKSECIEGNLNDLED